MEAGVFVLQIVCITFLVLFYVTTQQCHLYHHHVAGIAVLVIKVTHDQPLTAVYDHGICCNNRWSKFFWWAQSVKTKSSILQTQNPFCWMCHGPLHFCVNTDLGSLMLFPEIGWSTWTTLDAGTAVLAYCVAIEINLYSRHKVDN
jgi:hypothetical protein